MGPQSFGDAFDLAKLLRARDVARDLTYALAAKIEPGMTEEDAQALYKELCRFHPVERQWHPPKFRFGPNTVCNFKDVSVPYVLKDEDIFFVDIGPVVEGHEADYGETFTVGSSFELKHLCETQKTVFDEVARHWRKNGTAGQALYAFAEGRARARGFTLNLNQDGHRIGDFPHHVHFKGGLAECEEAIVPNAWILEIHLWGPGKRYGAFYEDLLL
jgi:Xaa-Pro aminopeptidase